MWILIGLACSFASANCPSGLSVTRTEVNILNLPTNDYEVSTSNGRTVRLRVGSTVTRLGEIKVVQPSRAARRLGWTGAVRKHLDREIVLHRLRFYPATADYTEHRFHKPGRAVADVFAPDIVAREELLGAALETWAHRDSIYEFSFADEVLGQREFLDLKDLGPTKFLGKSWIGQYFARLGLTSGLVESGTYPVTPLQLAENSNNYPTVLFFRPAGPKRSPGRTPAPR